MPLPRPLTHFLALRVETACSHHLKEGCHLQSSRSHQREKSVEETPVMTREDRAAREACGNPIKNNQKCLSEDYLELKNIFELDNS